MGKTIWTKEQLSAIETKKFKFTNSSCKGVLEKLLFWLKE